MTTNEGGHGGVTQMLREITRRLKEIFFQKKTWRRDCNAQEINVKLIFSRQRHVKVNESEVSAPYYYMLQQIATAK